MDYKLLQLTNNSIGAVAINGYMPLGSVTGRINCPYALNGAISVTTSGANVIVIGTSGFYKLNYTSSLTVAAAGDLAVSIVVNGTTVYTTTIAASEGENLIALNYEFRCKCDSIPTNVQLQLTGSAITDGTSNVIIEKVY